MVKIDNLTSPDDQLTINEREQPDGTTNGVTRDIDLCMFLSVFQWVN